MIPTLIYHFQSSQNQDGEFKHATYKVVYFFSAQGFLERRLLREIATSVPHTDADALTFLSLDDLRNFALKVCLDSGGHEVRLISVQDYNIGIDGASDLKGLLDVFQNFGEIAAMEGSQRKKGLFGKFFS